MKIISKPIGTFRAFVFVALSIVGIFFLYGPILHRIPTHRLFFSSVVGFPELKSKMPLDSNSGIPPGFITSLVALGPYHSGINRDRFYLGKEEKFKFDFLVQNLNGGLKKFSLTSFFNYRQTQVLTRKNDKSSWVKVASISDSIGANEKSIYNMELAIRLIKSGELVVVLEEEGDSSSPRKENQLYVLKPKYIRVFQLIKGMTRFEPPISFPHEKQKRQCEEKMAKFFLKNRFAIIENCTDEEISGVLFGSLGLEPVFYKTSKESYSVFKILPKEFKGHIYNVTSPYKPRENWLGKTSPSQKDLFGW